MELSWLVILGAIGGFLCLIAISAVVLYAFLSTSDRSDEPK